MAFLYPSFLWALTAVLVPVIIHLFNFRRYKKVYFSNVKFLRELQLESKSRSRLREILVLLARCLAIIALVLAFSRPFVVIEGGSTAQKGPRTIALYIDNSFSMENVGRQGPLLEVAKKRAREIIKAYGESTRFYIVTNNFEGREQRLNTYDNSLDFVEEIKVSPTPRQLVSVHERVKSFLGNETRGGTEFFVISDAQQSTFDLPALRPDSLLPLKILPLKANQVNNLYADSCWFDSPVQQKGFRQRLFATIVNKGTSNVEAGSARLYLNDQQVSLSTFSVRANGSVTVQFAFSQKTEGFNYGRIEIEDYPITFDDRLFYAFNARMNIRVVLITGASQPRQNAFTALFGNDSIFSLDAFSEQAINYGAFASADLVVLNQLNDFSSGLVAELEKFAAGGGGILVVPSASPSASYAKGLTALNLPVLGSHDTAVVQTASVDPGTGFFAGVFEKMDDRVNMPRVNSHYKLLKTGRKAPDRILTLENGNDLLVASRFKNAGVYLFSSPLLGNHSNFSRHALFVPTVFRIALSSVSQAPAYYGLHPDVVVRMQNAPDNSEQPPHIIGISEQADVIPEKRVVNNRMLLFPRNQLDRPGFYVVKQNNRQLLPLAFNYPRIESDLTAYSEEDLRAIVSGKGWKNVSVLRQTGADMKLAALAGAEDHQLWKLFIILALVFFLAEILLLRFLK